MNDYEERKQARIQRLKDRAERAAAIANAKFTEASELASAIPLGQPILIDHYSARADINFRRRINKKFEGSKELQEKAEYYAYKAEAAEKNNAISSDDPQAIEKLEQKLREEIESYERVKADYKARGKRLGYIANNANQRIRAIKERIAYLKKMRERVSRRYTVNGVDIFENVEDNRLQLFYPSKPDDETRALLKRNGFRWSPRNGAWQSYLKDVYYKLGKLGLREEEQCK